MHSVGIIGDIPNLRYGNQNLISESRVGGSYTYSEILIENLVSSYSRDFLVKIGIFGTTNRQIRKRNVEIYVVKTKFHTDRFLKTIYNFSYLPIKFFLLYNYIKNVDIFHLNNFLDSGFIKSFTPQTKVVYTVHGTLLRKNSWYSLTHTKKLLDTITYFNIRNGIKHSDAIITVGKGMDPELYILAKKYNKKIYLIPNGVDTSKFNPKLNGSSIREMYGIPEDAIVIISTSRFSYMRRIEMLIKAFAKLNKKYRDLYLLLVGTGPREAELKTLAKTLGLKRNIKFTGPVPYTQIHEYYRAADIAFNSFSNIPAVDIFTYTPSLKEAFKDCLPISKDFATLESIASGLPVVAVVKNVKNHNKAITKDSLESDCGIVVPMNDLTALIKALEILVKNKELREIMGNNGRDIAKRERDLKIMINKIVKVYKKVLMD